MASLDLHQKEGFDISLSNLSLVEEVSNKVEEKIRNRLELIRSRCLQLNDVAGGRGRLVIGKLEGLNVHEEDRSLELKPGRASNPVSEQVCEEVQV